MESTPQAPILSQYDIKRLNDKLRCRKYNFGKGQMVVAFHCPAAKTNPNAIGRLFSMKAEGEQKTIGEIIQVWPEREMVAVLIDTNPVIRAWVTRNLPNSEAKQDGKVEGDNREAVENAKP